MTTNYREFDDFASNEGGFRGGGASSLQSLSNDIQLFSKNVSVLEGRIALLNTSQDSYTLKREIIDMVGDTVQLAKMASTSIEKVKSVIISQSQMEKVQFGRLVSTFKSSLSKFQDIQQSTSELEHELLSKARSASVRKSASDYLPESERESPHLTRYEVADQHFNAQRQAQMQESSVVLEQREREMHQLEHDIVDINEIFRDLGTMVHEQGDVVDNIESNVETAAVRVDEGNKQLETAVRHKKCSRKLVCIITCIVVGVAVVLLITVIILVCAVGGVCKSS